MDDTEKYGAQKEYGKEYSPEGSGHAPEYNTEYGEHYDGSKGTFGRWMDGFKRDPNAHTTPRGAVGADGNVCPSKRRAVG